MTTLAERMLNLDPTSKFKVVDQPYALPSKCSFCGIGHNEDGKRVFIDTTLDLDWYGVVYICSTCFIQVAQALGFIAPEAWEKVVESSTNSLIENEQLKGENEGLRIAVSVLSNHRCYNAHNAESAQPGEGEAGKAASPIPGDTLESGKPKGSDTSESGDGEGLSDVRGNAAGDSAEHGKPAAAKPAAKRTTYLDDLLDGIHSKG